MHKEHVRPLARVVQGIQDSWEPVIATANFDKILDNAVWSPCNRFIAVTRSDLVEVLDAVTLSRISIFDRSLSCRDQLFGFSPDSRCLTLCTGYGFISWDLQTGGPLGIPSRLDHPYMAPFSFKHSKDGKVVTVAYRFWDFRNSDRKYDTFIYAYDLLSAERVGSRHVPEGRMIYPIWTHDEYLQFATIDPKSITIWQSPFTLEHPPVEVATLPVPDGITDADQFLFLPSRSRLAFILKDTIQVWDVRASKLLLKSDLTWDWRVSLNSGEDDFPWGSFSSDGRFFAYITTVEEVCVWKESSTHYLLHQRLSFFASSPFLRPRLSPNGESIFALLALKIHRWHTRDQVLSPSSVSTADSYRHHFILEFSLDENFAAFARRKQSMVTIIDLQSGEPKWNADMGVEIDCLRVAGDTVIVVSKNSIVTWNLPGGDRTFDASINNIVRATILDRSSPSYDLGEPCHMSISTDLSHIVVARISPFSLEVDDVFTGSCLASITTKHRVVPLFTRDGREVWADRYTPEEWKQYEIIEDGESGAIELKLQSIPHPQHEFFQDSSPGYTITDGGWVLSPSQKRLLWLPHRWRSNKWNRAWGGQFLGLLHSELSEVVVLEFLE